MSAVLLFGCQADEWGALHTTTGEADAAPGFSAAEWALVETLSPLPERPDLDATGHLESPSRFLEILDLFLIGLRRRFEFFDLLVIGLNAGLELLEQRLDLVDRRGDGTQFLAEFGDLRL